MDYPKTEAGLRARIEALTTLMRTEREERKREDDLRLESLRTTNNQLKETNDRLEETTAKLKESVDRLEETTAKLKESVDRLRNKRRTPY